MSSALEWQVGVVCQNERARIATCLESISAAIGSRRAIVNLIVNGSSDGSDKVALRVAADLALSIRIFTIGYGDKSHAINCLIHDPDIRVDANLYFFIDGYVRVHPGALEAMQQAVLQNPNSVAATGIAATGRSEPQAHRATLARGGGTLHGQLFALRRSFIDGMVNGALRLPIGLYRGDGLLGSMAAHNLDPLGQRWVNQRVLCVAEALFDIKPLSPFRPRDLRRHLRRKVRQMRGRLENGAIKQVIYRDGYGALPAFADDLIADFLKANGMPGVGWQDRLFMQMALRQHRAAKKPVPEDLTPVRIL
jgi:glycosyltransferase involved in cell wall biosynthesis